MKYRASKGLADCDTALEVSELGCSRRAKRTRAARALRRFTRRIVALDELIGKMRSDSPDERRCLGKPHVAPITYLTTVEFGAGALSTLPDQLAAVGMTRPLIVSDHGLAATGLVRRIEKLCPPGAPVFLDVPPNPTEAASRAALAVYQAHRCDGLCSVGGGSPIDLAKCVALLASHSGPLESYAAIYGGISRITGTIAPVIAIPTTQVRERK